MEKRARGRPPRIEISDLVGELSTLSRNMVGETVDIGELTCCSVQSAIGILSDYKDLSDAALNIEHERDWDDCININVYISYKRSETDKELVARVIAADKAREKARETAAKEKANKALKEKEEYERLKKKFGNDA